MFEEMIQSIKDDTVEFCFNVTVETRTERKQILGKGQGIKQEYDESEDMMLQGGADSQVPEETEIPERENKQQTVRRDTPKVGRNDPCP